MQDNKLEAVAIAWLQQRVEYEASEVAKAEHEVAAFEARAITEPSFECFARSWAQHRDRARERHARYVTLLSIVADRDEWRTQHENLLAIRQQELAARREGEGR